MPEEQKSPIQKPEHNSESLSRGIGVESKVRRDLEKRLTEQPEKAELLTETVYDGSRLRKTLFWVAIFFILIISATVVFSTYIVPAVITNLPNIVQHPDAVHPAHRRVFQGTVDYNPVFSADHKLTGIQEFDSGAVYSFVTSAMVVPQQGLEGIVRVDFNKAPALRPKSDLDIAYKLLWSSNTSDYGLYFIINEWPKIFSYLRVPAAEQKDWYVYDSQKASKDFALVDILVPALKPSNARKDYDAIVASIWTSALQTQTLRPRVDLLSYDAEHARWILRVSATLDPMKTPLFLEALKNNTSLRDKFNASTAIPIEYETFLNLIQSTRSFSGTMSIGIFDKIMYAHNWNFSIANSSLGSFQGTLSSSVTPQKTATQLVKPPVATDASQLIEQPLSP